VPYRKTTGQRDYGKRRKARGEEQSREWRKGRRLPACRTLVRLREISQTPLHHRPDLMTFVSCYNGGAFACNYGEPGVFGMQVKQRRFSLNCEIVKSLNCE